ncbi:MAG: LPS export ABC transporter periplasmic protein LptC [Methylophaga sp.]|nr:MAG: LPS export ABC transporter periplasmic protein LptC [Methylophaga sp.]
MNAISNIPFIAKILLALLAIISIWLLSGEENKNGSVQENKQTRTSDYSMTNFTLTVMDESGSPSRVITGDKMAHYPDDDSTEILFPVAHIIDQEKDNWLISSNKGQTQGKGDEIKLTGNVIITRQDNNEIELHTEELILDTLHNTAYTDLAVSIKSPYGNTNSVGLHAALEDKMINLHSRVKGHYNAPPSQ